MKTARRTKKKLPAALQWLALGGMAAAAIGFGVKLTAAPNDYLTLAQKPLYLASNEAPLMMMVMSRDERLFTKAYSDYTDLDGDGVLDTTYKNTFVYEGYFDSNLCYGYSSGRFSAVNGAEDHRCSGSGQWSGNFLNWVTMSRLDILRYVLYGGRRIEDTETRTILERAHIPNDLHAWVKVYDGNDIGDFAPLSGPQSFCNSSHGNADNEPPIFRQANGNWSEWAATALNQCRINYNSDTPATATSYTVRVEVCDPSADPNLRESFCRSYSDGDSVHYKPAGLLQSYGESNRLRFGMITGSYSKPRSGGVLRRNIGRIAGNGAGCSAGNEIDLATGQLCNQDAGDEGIINTLDRFRLTKWQGWVSDGKWVDCNEWGILNRQGQGRDRSLNNPGTGSDNCSAWGNPIAEMYAEALRYIAGETAPTPGFNNGGADLLGLPAPAWLDPYRSPDDGGNSYCASCNILVMSSSLPSFDSDEIPNIPHIGSVDAATDVVGDYEGITGESYLLGRVGTTPLNASLDTHQDICSAENVNRLSLARGVCPDIPSLEGSYLVAGMAHKSRTTDMRPGLSGKPAAYKNTVTTYAVALADNLPKFDVSIGGQTISLAPLCQAHASGNAAISNDSNGGWRTCALGSVSIGAKTSSVWPHHVYGRDLIYDADGNAVAGSFSLVWEDSLWGNDHDNDVVAMLSYCVGDACSVATNPNHSGAGICWRSDSPVCTSANGNPNVGSNEVLVRVENLSAYAGNGMLSGFAVTGSSNDGVYRLARRPGGNHCGGGSCDDSILTSSANPPVGWDAPKVMRFSPGSSEAGLLEGPLWYAAKYGGRLDDVGVPVDGEWDSRESGQPDNYFFARDPSALKAELGRIFEAAANEGATSAGGGAGARIGDASFTIEAGFDVPDESTDWVGYLRALEVTSTGGAGNVLWNVADHIPSPSNRRIYTVRSPGSGAELEAVEFTAGNLGVSEEERLGSLGVPAPAPAWLGDTPSASSLVSYIRGNSVSGFRERSSILGSIINSQPQVAMPNDDYGYGDWTHTWPDDPAWKDSLGEGYKAFLGTKASRTPMIYVGANDGMLHAFNASRSTSSGGGDEVFAFIPAGARNHLYELANPGYDHRYFVDGELAVADVSFTSTGSGNWQTVLVGSTGAGGAAIPSGGTSAGHGSVFALNVSSPAGFDGDDVLWELSGQDDEYLGFVLGKPVIVPVGAGTGGAPRWVAIFGNGPNSDDGRPVLFVVDIRTGEVLSRLMPASSGYASRNGLMNIAPIAISNRHGLVDTVYGGDLQGNLWKFDLSDPNPGNWGIAYGNGNAPLFTAGIGDSLQPIAGGIEVSSGPGGGVSVFFGTGSYFAEEDRDNNGVQSLYAIWDNLSNPISGRGALVGHSLRQGGVSSGYRFRGIEASPVNYVASRGWYVDLVIEGAALGERFIGTPRLQSGKVIFVAYEPNEAMVCATGGGVNWEYALDMMTGAGGMSGISTEPGGESVCVGDCAGIALEGGGTGGDDGPSAPVRNTSIFVPPITPCDPDDDDCTVEDLIEAERCTFVLRAPGADALFMPRPCGRQSWRQLQ